jgi:hypothetical protein
MDQTVSFQGCQGLTELSHAPDVISVISYCAFPDLVVARYGKADISEPDIPGSRHRRSMCQLKRVNCCFVKWIGFWADKVGVVLPCVRIDR